MVLFDEAGHILVVENVDAILLQMGGNFGAQFPQVDEQISLNLKMRIEWATK